ncbi:MAG: DUF2061 domain-containing protein [Chloroflexi bacterium]|nr:DUF2061 domain-containing protein [Chloroflexota bacterium]
MDTKARSLTKAISWRVVAFLVLGAISYAFTGNWQETAFITVVYNVVQIFIYFLHERVWDLLTWGRRRDVSHLPPAVELPQEEVESIREKLRLLGYLD